MKRRLLTVLSVLSLVLCVVANVMWVRSRTINGTRLWIGVEHAGVAEQRRRSHAGARGPQEIMMAD